MECFTLDEQMKDWRKDIINNLTYLNNPISRKVKVLAQNYAMI